MSNLSELLPTGGGQNAVDFVASGTLPNGKAVILKADGTVEDGGNSSYGTAVTGQIASTLVTTNVASFIGIASEAISSAATGSVNVYGGINEVQTGLTIGSDYYAQADGTITTTSTSPAVKVGQAISATTINMVDWT